VRGAGLRTRELLTLGFKFSAAHAPCSRIRGTFRSSWLLTLGAAARWRLTYDGPTGSSSPLISS
jgi:hypothetical protein